MRAEREATFADALQAVAGGNESAVKTLIGLSPELADYARSLVVGDARRMDLEQ